MAARGAQESTPTELDEATLDQINRHQSNTSVTAERALESRDDPSHRPRNISGTSRGDIDFQTVTVTNDLL